MFAIFRCIDRVHGRSWIYTGIFIFKSLTYQIVMIFYIIHILARLFNLDILYCAKFFCTLKNLHFFINSLQTLVKNYLWVSCYLILDFKTGSRSVFRVTTGKTDFLSFNPIKNRGFSPNYEIYCKQ